MIGEMSVKVAAFVRETQQMPATIERGFNAMRLSAMQSNDELQLMGINLITRS